MYDAARIDLSLSDKNVDVCIHYENPWDNI